MTSEIAPFALHAAKASSDFAQEQCLLTRECSARALEDAATIGTLLGKINSKLQIPLVTTLYEKMRKERTDRIRDETFKQREEHHLADGKHQVARDEHLARSFDVHDVW